MKKFFYSLLILSISPILSAQNPINFTEIDIIKSEDSDPVGFASTPNYIYFVAEDNYYPELWKLNKQSEELIKSAYTKKDIEDSRIFGAHNNWIYWMDTNDFRDYKLYKVTDAAEETILLSGFENLNFLDQEDKRFLHYEKDNQVHLARFTEEGIKLLYSDDLFSEQFLGDEYVFSINGTKLTKISIKDDSVEEIQIPEEFQSSTYNTSYYKGKVYYNQRNTSTYNRTVTTYDIEKKKFENISFKDNEFVKIFASNNIAVLTSNYGIYKIDANHKIEQISIPTNSYVWSIKHVGDNIYIQLFSFYEEPQLLVVNATGITKFNAFVNLEYSIYHNEKFYFINNEQLISYNPKTNKELVLHEKLKYHKILGVDNNKIYLNASTTETGKELYAYNIITDQIEFFGDINFKPNTNPRNFYNAGNKVFYQGNNYLYVSDGKLNGTKRLLNDKNLTVNNFMMDGDLVGLEFNGKFLFGGDKGNDAGQELWVTDGTDEGTFDIEINNFTSGPHAYKSGFLNFIAKTPTKVYFNGFTNEQGNEIWVTDGTVEGTKIVKDLSPGGESPMLSIPKNVTVGEKLYFVKLEYYDSDYRSDLWVTDGTESGTKKITELTDFWNWYSHYYVTILAADKDYVYYLKQFEDPSYENNKSGKYIHKINLKTLEETRLELVTSDRVFKDSDYIYFATYENNKMKYTKYNFKTNEKEFVMENVGYEFAYLNSCGDYSIFGNRDYFSNISDLYFYNNKNKSINKVLDENYTNTADKNVLCINNNYLIKYNSYYNRAIDFYTIKEDKVENVRAHFDGKSLMDFLGTEVIYNDNLNKIFSSTSINQTFELAVADFEMNTLNTIDHVKPNSKNNNIHVSPNPVENFVNIKAEDKILEVSIYDITGRKQKVIKGNNSENLQINLMELPKGIFFMKTITTQGTSTNKIIKR